MTIVRRDRMTSARATGRVPPAGVVTVPSLHCPGDEINVAVACPIVNSGRGPSMHRAIRILSLSFVIASNGVAVDALAAKATECTKIGICYCVNDELKATIQSKVDRFRQTIADERKSGKAVGYLSVPLTSGGGGNFNVGCASDG